MHFPESFKNRIARQFPQEADQFLDALTNPPANSIRFNTAKLVEGKKSESIPWCDEATYLEERPVYSLDPLFHAGAYYVQESSSMVLGYIFNLLRTHSTPWNVLDLCAAPGGKSTHLLNQMTPEDVLVANEINPIRNAILQENLAKWGYPNVLISRSDPAQFAKLKPIFHCVCVDAPCSGEGMFRKDPETVNEWSPENLQTCSLRQNRILHDVWPSIQPGGYLVYSTCTFNPEENELLLQPFIDEMGARSIDIPISDDWGISKSQRGDVHYLQFLPHQSKGEGFFIAVIQKPGELSDVPAALTSRPAPKEVASRVSLLKPEWGPYVWIHEENDWKAQTLRSQMLFDQLKKHLYFTSYALDFGKLIRDELIPSQELAWSIAFQQDSYPVHDLTESEALEYLRKSSTLNFKSEKGWVLVRYKNVPVGWVKQLGNRINNYYPANYRLRMQS